MNFKRIGRMFLCLLLVCCLLIQASPIKAHATGMEGILGGLIAPVPAPIVIGSILIGLGITAVETGVFEELVGFVEDKLEAAGEVVNGMIDTWVVSDGETETYTVSEGLVKGAFDAAYESGMVFSAPSFNGALVSGGSWVFGKRGGLVCPVDANLYLFSISGTSCAAYLVSAIPFESGTKRGTTNVESIVSAELLTVDGIDYYYISQYFWPTDDQYTQGFTVTPNIENLILAIRGELAVDSTVSAVEGLDATKLAAQDILNIADAYKNWDANKVLKQDSEDPDKKMPYWPIAPMDTLELTANTSQEDVWAGLHDYTTTVLDNWDILLNGITSIKNGIKAIPQAFANGFAKIEEVVKSIPDTFASWFDTLIEYGAATLNWLATVPGMLAGCLEPLVEYGAAVLEFLSGLVGALYDTFADLFEWLFCIPEDHYNHIIDDLIDDFPFLDSMVNFSKELVNVFYGIGSKPPILYIDLSAAEGNVFWGERVVFLDLTWYERYKPYGDAIISSFLWSLFGWKLLHILPGVLNGASGVVPGSSNN